jgi:hypothetical protein
MVPADEVIFRRRRRRVDDHRRSVALVRAVLDRRQVGARLEARSLRPERYFAGPAFPGVVVVFVVVVRLGPLVAVEVAGKASESKFRK